MPRDYHLIYNYFLQGTLVNTNKDKNFVILGIDWSKDFHMPNPENIIIVLSQNWGNLFIITVEGSIGNCMALNFN